MIDALLIAGVGGFAGTCGRYLTGVAAKKWFGANYPWGTFLVNVVGCFIIGIFFGIYGRGDMDTMVKALLITGFCGGFTTFSSFSHDALKMIAAKQWGKFVTYVVSSVVLGIFFVWLGMQCIG